MVTTHKPRQPPLTRCHPGLQACNLLVLAQICQVLSPLLPWPSPSPVSGHGHCPSTPDLSPEASQRSHTWRRAALLRWATRPGCSRAAVTGTVFSPEGHSPKGLPTTQPARARAPGTTAPGRAGGAALREDLGLGAGSGTAVGGTRGDTIKRRARARPGPQWSGRARGGQRRGAGRGGCGLRHSPLPPSPLPPLPHATSPPPPPSPTARAPPALEPRPPPR